MEKKKSKKRGKWIKSRHKVVCFLLRYTLGVYSKLKYHAEVKKLGEKKERQYLVLFNHQTAFDQFFVSISFKRPLYYVASEDLFSSGLSSALIKFLVAPIPIKKQANDMNGVLNCMRVAKEGGSIALSPEGNRTYSGKTEYMKPSIVQLVRALKLPLALYRIEGGYGVHPRWSDVVRCGKMKCYVSKILETEEINSLSDDELFEVIKNELYVNEGVQSGEFLTKKQAEYLERAIYSCPDCGLSEFESNGDIIRCKKCGKAVRYMPTKELVGINCDFPFKFVTDWYDYQSDFINSLDVKAYTDAPIYEDKASLTEVIPYKKKMLISDDCDLSLYGDRLIVKYADSKKLFLPFDEASAVTVLGKNKVNVYHKGHVYQLKGNKRFCGLKYVNIYYRYKNSTSEVKDGKFLGI